MSAKSISATIVLVISMSPVPSGAGSPTTAAVTTHVIIVATGPSTCEQRDFTTGVPAPMPKLSEQKHEQIKWEQLNATHHYTVKFSGANPPFPGAGTFHENDTSPAPLRNLGDHSYASVTVTSPTGTVHCNNFRSMGVHVDQ
jgi:hypothetical protein